jgi:hypothetical protein
MLIFILIDHSHKPTERITIILDTKTLFLYLATDIIYIIMWMTSLRSVSRFENFRGLDVLERYGPPGPVTGLDLPFYFLLDIILKYVCTPGNGSL